MKKKICSFLFIFLLLICSGCKKTSLDITSSNTQPIRVTNQVVTLYKEDTSIESTSLTKAIEKVYDSVVVINSYFTNGYGSGSGVIIGESEKYSYIITCHHVIEKCFIL